jgi:magnesium transporter
MARFIRTQQESIGSSPYDLVFTGRKKTEQTLLRLIDFTEDTLDERQLHAIEEGKAYIATGSTTWINVDGVHDTEVMQAFSETFNISTLVLADVLDTESRSKVIDYEDCLLISTKMLSYDETEDEVIHENLVLILKDRFLFTFQERRGDVFEPVRERIRKGKKRIRMAGPDYLAYALLDVVVDNYLLQIGRIGEKIEDLDDELIENPDNSSLDKINRFKREVNFLRKVIKPSREMIVDLERLESEDITSDVAVHLDELKTRIEMANDAVDSYRDVLSDQLNIFHTTVAYKLNDILKVLTIFSVIFIPITFIAGIYGTNFDYIPELKYRYSYFIMWGAIIAVVIGMLGYFRRKGWF